MDGKKLARLTAYTKADPVHAPRHWKIMYKKPLNSDTRCVSMKAKLTAGLMCPPVYHGGKLSFERGQQ